MKIKCETCKGKGGWSKLAGRFAIHISCQQCKGKGKWWTNNKVRNKSKDNH